MEIGRKESAAFLWQNVKKVKHNIIFLMLVQAFHGISGMLHALLLREVIDHAVEKETQAFFRAFLWMAALLLLQIAARCLVRHLEEKVRAGVENKLKERLFRTLLGKDYAEVTSMHSGEWMTRLTSDTAVVADGVTTIFPGAISMVMRLCGSVIVLLVLVPGVGFAMVAVGVLMLAFTTFFRRILKRMHKQMQEADGKVRVFLQEHLGSLMIIKVFQAEEQVAGNAKERMEEHRTIRMKRNRFANVCSTGFALALRGAYLVGACGCGYGIIKGTVSYGTLTAVLQMINQVQTPLAGMTGYVPKFYAMLSSTERLMEAEYFSEDRTVPKEECTGSAFAYLQLKKAGFAYPDKEEAVFSQVSMKIERGEFVAFVGSSGCGKSTLMKVLLGLYPLTEGLLEFGTEDIKGTVHTRAYGGELFSFVPQGKHLMNGSIRDVIIIGDRNKETDEERLREVLHTACAEFVWELEDGVDTELGEQGAGLSEGQLQRLSIARALYCDRPVLILDEATSALDESTEKLLLANLRELRDKTVLVVTHRPAALAICDRVIDMETW